MWSFLSGWLKIVACSALVVLTVGVGLALAQDVPSTGPGSEGPISGYRLGTGDKIRITIFGQTDFNGDYDIDSSGNVQLPLIGSFHAAGLTVDSFRRNLAAKLSDGYFVNPSITVAVVNYRPFYIIGEVNKPGEYPYVSGMSILNAVALAGGYTTRANDSEAYVRRAGQNKEISVPADQTTKVEPGDIVRIPERFF